MDVVISGVSMKLVMLEESVHVQRVVMPGSGVSSWTVLGDDDAPGGADRAVSDVSDRYRPVAEHGEGVCARSEGLWVSLQHRGLDWREVRLEDIGEYVAWLSLPPSGRVGRVAVLPSVQPHVAPSTANCYGGQVCQEGLGSGAQDRRRGRRFGCRSIFTRSDERVVSTRCQV